MNFGSHKALVAAPEAHQHDLAGPELGDAVAAQRLHVDEDVLRALAAGQEAEPLGAVEPLDQRALEPAFGRHRDMRALLLHFGRMHGGGRIHRQHAKGLHAALALLGKADDARAFERGLETVAPEAGDVEEDVADLAAIGQDEAVALGDVEPLDRAGNLDEIGIAAIVPGQRVLVARVTPHRRGLVPHQNAPFPSTATPDS